MNHHSFLKNQVAVLATMHRKEKVISPLLEQELGLKVIVPDHFDTDVFGTFTRDVKRKGSQLEAARLKAQKAMELTGETIALASEGIFAPHPDISFIPCNREIVMLCDREHELEIVGEEVSTATNFNHQVVSSERSAYDFAIKVG